MALNTNINLFGRAIPTWSAIRHGSLTTNSVSLTTEDVEIINVCKLCEEIYNVRIVLSGKRTTPIT